MTAEDLAKYFHPQHFAWKMSKEALTRTLNEKKRIEKNYFPVDKHRQHWKKQVVASIPFYEALIATKSN